MKGWLQDIVSALFWSLIVIVVVLFSTGSGGSFIYNNF